MTTYLLVHGGFTDGSYWADTAAALQRAGHRVLVAELPSTGPDPEGLGDLADDAAEVRRLLDAAGEPVVLVGHSYGGVVLTEVADHPAIAHTVYVGAFWPERGQTILESEGARAVADYVQMTADMTAARIPDWETARRHLFADVPEATAREAFARLGYSSGAAVTQPCAAPDRHHPTTYVVLEDDLALTAASQEVLARKADHVARLATSHSPMLADPEGLAATLSRVPVAVG
ncbi:alpha/beta fold hydrolase [Blastococcus sp. SYSU D00669]